MNHPLHVSLIWIYNLPYVKDVNGNFALPIIRQYLQRDYIDMIKISRKYPNLRISFNIVPHLIEQLSDYVFNNATDYTWILSQKPADELTITEKDFILTHFFKGVDNVIIAPYPRYRELYEKKTELDKKGYMDGVSPYFSTAEIRDLQIWHNMAWIGKESQQDTLIDRLISKDRNFTETDKSNLIDYLKSLHKSMFDLYEEELVRRRIEISTTAFYNPIIPLALDNHSVHTNSDSHLPMRRFQGSELVKRQILHARRFSKRVFNQTSLGIQSPESALNAATLDLFAKLRFNWTVLERDHVDKDLAPEAAAFPFEYTTNNIHRIDCLVNQWTLSDKFVHVYPNMEPRAAVADFFESLNEIRRQAIRVRSDSPPHVTIAVPGDVIWDVYQRQGLEFLNALYNGFEAQDDIVTVLPSEYLRNFHLRTTIHTVHSHAKNGFDKWMGSRPVNHAWDKLDVTYSFFKSKEHEGQFSEKTLKQVRQDLQIALCSHWFSSYTSEPTKWDVYFDDQFRMRLIQCYERLYQKAPNSLFYNFKNESASLYNTLPLTEFIYPRIDGFDTGISEWVGAALYDVNKYHLEIGNQLYQHIETLSVGQNETEICIRVTFASFPPITTRFQLHFHSPDEHLIELQPMLSLSRRYRGQQDKWREEETDTTFELNEILEIVIPAAELNIQPKSFFSFQLQLMVHDEQLERFPSSSVLRVTFLDQIETGDNLRLDEPHSV